MVKNGFSLLDVKQLYIDELFDYYGELVYILEQAKELPEGSYEDYTADITGEDKSIEKMFDFFKQKQELLNKTN